MAHQQRDLFDREPAPWELDAARDLCVATVVFSEMPFGPFDYQVPEELRAEVEPGRRLKVPLGRGDREVTAYCVRVAGGPAPGVSPARLKAVRAVMDPAPLLSPALLELSEWLGERYLCEWGQALEAILPAGVRTNAGSREVIYLHVSPEVVARLPELKLPPKQLEVLRLLGESPQPLTPQELGKLARCSPGPIQELRRKKLLQVRKQPLERGLPPAVPGREPPVELNSDQQVVLEAVLGALRAGRQETFLLRGVTGSGKTEVYIRSIEEAIAYGRQAIVLVPEISLTPQTRQRFQSRFANVAVLHSHLSDAERHWHWQRIATGAVEVVVGARSAVFAPTPQLGLLVIDEEHDPSFKQDQTPRYHAREVALRRAQAEKVPLLLGSATPSLESWGHAQQGAYRLVELPRRVLDRPLPEVGVIDLRTEFQNRRHRGALSRPLYAAVRQSLEDKGQVILLLNRRGFSTSIQCPACGQTVRCPHCDIALTHHQTGEMAICHYCDYQVRAPQRCPECQSDQIRYAGFGTQKLEAEVRWRFPQARVLRMDSDTMRKPGSHERALASFRDGEVDVLLGTQMIAKGLDFPNVTLVGVINADTALHFPDFRAAERTFHLVTQVAGRTGRGIRGGRVLVQTFSPEHPAIQFARRHDFLGFAEAELKTRERYGYPPRGAMIRVIVRGPRQESADQTATAFAQAIEAEGRRRELPLRLLGPAPAPIAKLRGLYRYHFLVLGAEATPLRAVVRSALAPQKPPEEVQWAADVDPVDML